MADIAKVTVDKLNNDNYQTWKYEAELVLRRENTWFAVVNPAPATTDKSYQAWIHADSKAIGTIGLLVEKSQHVHTRPAKTAREAWENLRSHHEKASLSSTVHMYTKLASMKLAENGDVEALIQEIEFIVDSLIAVGEPVTDRFRIGMMLGNLPNSYSVLITALECRAEADLTVGMVREKILGECKRRKSIDNVTVVTQHKESALKVQDDGQRKKVKSKTKAVCHFCHIPGHFKKNCFKYKAHLKAQAASSTEQSAKIITESRDSDRKAGDSASHFCFTIHEGHRDAWYVDSGASCHITNDKRHFDTFDEGKTDTVRIADGGTISTQGTGSLTLLCTNPAGAKHRVTVSDVRYIPQLDSNLLSVRSLTKLGFEVRFEGEKCFIMSGNTVVATANAKQHLYKLNCEQQALLTEFATNANCLHAWHRRLGHRNPESIKLLINKSLATGIHIDKCDQTIVCDTCVKGKMARLPFPKRSSTETRATLDLVHSDLCGPMQTQTPGGKKYIMTMIDDFSRYCTVYLLAQKNEVSGKIQEFVKKCLNEFGRKPKIVRSDRGREYLNADVQSFFSANGIEHQTTAPYSPQQNGVAERKNRSLTEMARCMLIDAGLPHTYWGEAVVTANYVQNRLPTDAVDKTPYELWYDRQPNLQHVRTFGCKVFMHIPDEKRRKLDNKAVELRFVGYAEGSKAYRLLDTATNRIYFSRDVKFIEGCHDTTTEGNTEPEVDQEQHDRVRNNHCAELSVQYDYTDDVNDTSTDDEGDPAVAATGRTTRISARQTKGIAPTRLIDTCNVVSWPETDEPQTFKQAITGPDRTKWKDAMEDEMQSLHHNDVWTLTELPEGRKAIGGKWVYKRKLDGNGDVSRYKARYVAQGYSQIYGEDYDEVFAPVAKQTTLRALLTVAGKRGMIVRHYDIKTAFLNGDLKEDIFMKQPLGFVEKGKEHLVCKLKKSIYGLKQSARAWNHKIHEVLTQEGLQRSSADPCLYSMQINGQCLYLLVYVDDLFVASDNQGLIDRIAKRLGKCFDLCCLGDPNYYLGIHIDRGPDGIFRIHQQGYIDRVITRFGMQDSKPSKIPLDPGYEKRDEVHVKLPNNEQYRSAIGSLLYIATFTRPDIAVATSILSRKINNPTEADWEEVKRVLRYLKYTRDICLRLGEMADDMNDDHNGLIGYADANWAGDTTDRKSNSGYLFKLFGSPISWASRKQTCISLSSTEAEYVSLSEACQEAVWLMRLIEDLNVKPNRPCVMYEDNQSCLKLLDSEKTSNRTKHIDTRYHFVKDLKNNNRIKFIYCPTEEMVADILTKPLEAVKTRKLVSLIGFTRL